MSEKLEQPFGGYYTAAEGGPAFPFKATDQLVFSGMAVRDYFAAKAMQALLNNPRASQLICDGDARYNGDNFAECIAINAYEFAEAMTKARLER